MTDRGISSEEVGQLVNDALMRHAKPSEQGTLVPGFATITVDEDVALRALGATLHKGLYLINRDELQGGLHIKVYALSFSKFGIQTHDELQRMVEQGEAEREVLENGTEKISLRTADIKITGTVKPLTVSKREQPITLDEIGVWMAYAELIEQGEEDKAEALLMSAYASPENPIEEAVTADPTDKGLRLNPLAAKLDAMPLDYSFAAKVLQGFEEIAFGSDNGKDGVFQLTPKKSGSKQKVELSATPKSCADYVAKSHANWQLAARLHTTVNEMLKDKDAPNHMAYGRVWISTKAIIGELSRTKRGVNESLKRNESFKETINAGLSMLSGSQITAYGHDGKLAFKGYFLNAEYREAVTLPNGTTVRDVWGFMPLSEDKSFALFTEGQTKKMALLDRAPLKETEIWIPQFLEAGVLSEIRAHLYPTRGKGAKQYKAKRSWESIFIAADPKANGNLSGRVKQRIVNEIDRQLREYAEAEKTNAKPIWIAATSTRDGAKGRGEGAWGMLEIVGYAYPVGAKKAVIDIGAKQRTSSAKKGEGK